MSEKTLHTRILNKNTTYDKATTSSFVPKLGEIVLAKLDVAQHDGQTVPTFLMKVGDDSTPLKDLKWLHAPASDVYAWAKNPTKPAYGATEIARGSSTVAADLTAAETAIQNLQAAIGSSGSVAEMISTAIAALDVDASTDTDGIIISSISEVDGKINVTRRAITADDIPELAIAKISGLQAALDAKAVETSVAERFGAVDTKIGTSDDAAGTATVYGAIATAKKAGDDAQKTIDDYKTANDLALADVQSIAEAATTVEEAEQIAADAVTFFENGNFALLQDTVSDLSGTVEGHGTEIESIKADYATIAAVNDHVSTLDGKITAEAERAADVEGGLDTRLTAAEAAIQTLNAATTFAGTGTYAEMLAKDVAAGSIFVVIDTTDEGKQYNNKEFVYDGENWVELGDTTAELAAINDHETRLAAVEADLGADGDTTKAIAAAQADATQALADAAAAAQAAADALGEAKGYTDTEVGKVDTKITNHTTATGNVHGLVKADIGLGNVDNKSVAEIKTEFTGSVAANDDKFVTGGAVYTAIDAAKAAAAEDATTKANAVDAKVAALTTTVETNATTAADATKAVADDLAAEILRADAAEKAAAALGQQGINDAAAVATALSEYKTANDARVKAIEDDYLRAADTFIIDCGGVE